MARAEAAADAGFLFAQPAGHGNLYLRRPDADNKVLKSVAIHYNDSPTEITRIGARFLTELFPDVSVSPQAAVQDFTDSCDEKAKEFNDVTNNRINFHILSGTYSDITVDIDAARTSADVSGRCTFVDIPADPNNPFYGKRESVSGICTLTAMYENWRWFLCSSHFKGLGTVLLARSSTACPEACARLPSSSPPDGLSQIVTL